MGDRFHRNAPGSTPSGSGRSGPSATASTSWAWDCWRQAARWGFSKQNWVVNEGAIGYAIAALGVAAFIEPMTWRDLEVRVSGNGLALEW